MGYKKCPRCELNWIKDEDEYCDVCKTELRLKGGIVLIEDDEDEILEEERLCPECKMNYIREDEKMCATCRAELGNKPLLEKDVIVPDVVDDVEDDESWRDFVEDEVIEPLDEDEIKEISLTELAEEEESFDEEESIDDFEPIDLGDYPDEDLDEDGEEDEKELDDNF
jgi:hypothetical protein